jgi:hypothetical protein
MVPVVAQFAGKALGAAVGTAFAIKAQSLPGKILGAVAPVVVGHLIDEAVPVVCGRCGSPIRRSA